MSNAALAKILRAVCAAFILGISFPVAGQAQNQRILSHGLERHRVSSHHATGSTWHGSRGVTARRLAFYDDWRQSYWPYWGWDMAASVLATDPFYYSYYYGFGYGDEVLADACAVAYCVQRFRSYDRASGTYFGRDGYRHACP